MKTSAFFETYESTSLTVNRAVNKLARAGIEVFNVRKIGKTRIRLSVRAKDSEKFFAIFRGSCYTINKMSDRGAKKWAAFALYRIGAVVGAALFCLLVYLSGLFVYKVEVVGSGSHYREEVCALLSQAGLSPFSAYSEEKAEQARTYVLDLPAVSFCSVQKKGGVIVVGVEVNAETPAKVPARSLVAGQEGTVLQLICIRGTPQVNEGDFVESGATLVAGYAEYGEGESQTRREVAAIAKAVLECKLVYEHKSAEESEAAQDAAYAEALLRIGEGEVLEKQAEVRPESDGFVYRVEIRYTAVFAVNMD